MRRIGVLMAVAESDADVRKGIAIFQQRLQELGWRDGQNIRIDYRWGDADPRRIQALAKELVDLRPDALVGHSTPSARGLLNQTRSIPIVFLTVTDPLGQGLVSSLSRPNGNITGFSVFEFSLGTKWVETLRQIACARSPRKTHRHRSRLLWTVRWQQLPLSSGLLWICRLSVSLIVQRAYSVVRSTV
jgi:putative tryptophan/tyrosine transport system substrate-binding protein